MSKMLLAGIIIVIVAIAAVAGAYVLLSNNTGTSDQNDNDSNSNTSDQTNDTSTFDLSNGDYMEFKTTTESNMTWINVTMKWLVFNVTSSGYDVTIDYISDFFNNTITQHANLTDAVGSGAVDDNYTKGTLVGSETLSTPFGAKQVEHWRLTTEEGTTTTVADYYVGKDTKMVYKVVVTSADSSDSGNSMTTTTVLTNTNIDRIKNGDKA
jgi:hypothetical protein